MKNRIKVASFLVVAITLTWGIAFRSTSEAVMPYTNSLINVDNSGNQANNAIDGTVYSISKDGRYVAFSSYATNLVSGDTNGQTDVFVRDRVANTTTRVSVSSGGTQGNYGSFFPRITPNGHYVVFASNADNLTSPGGVPGHRGLYVRNMQSNATEQVYLTSTGSPLNDMLGHFVISADARYIVFTTAASNVVSGDTNGESDVFVKDRKLGTITLISKSDSGVIGNDNIVGMPSISCDGALIAFSSHSTNLVSGDTNGQGDIFLVDRVGGHTIKNITINGNGGSSRPNISCDGSTILFNSYASNFGGSDTNNAADYFTYDVASESTERVSVSTSGAEANAGISGYASISGDGRYVTFPSTSTNLVSGDTNGQNDVFVRDRSTGITQRVSMRDAATQTTNSSYDGYISSDGSTIVFSSDDTGLIPGISNSVSNLFTAETGLEQCSI